MSFVEYRTVVVIYKCTWHCRLSELASTRLRANNPGIADLSDPNRATKLAERLSELYDNEWTDCFEQIKKESEKKTTVSDKRIAEHLRNILEVSQNVHYLAKLLCVGGSCFSIPIFFPLLILHKMVPVWSPEKIGPLHPLHVAPVVIHDRVRATFAAS